MIGDLTQPRGQKIVAILLFEDLLIVPLLAIVAFMAPNHVVESTSVRLENIELVYSQLQGLLRQGIGYLTHCLDYWPLLKPRSHDCGGFIGGVGCSVTDASQRFDYGDGCFLAGVLLSESTFRHQIEADIEPFRGILLGLFFLGVGMSLDLSVVAQNWQLIVCGVIALMLVKALMIYMVARVTKKLSY